VTGFPVSLDDLIAYVNALRPGGGPVDQVADAFAVSTQLEVQSDALVGYFVEQARRAGVPWSQIGAAMGVSRQAAQQRFVAGRVNVSPRVEMFARFTQRARNVVAAARRIGMVDQPGPEVVASVVVAGPDVVSSSPPAPGIGAGYLAAALLAEPDGLGAVVIGRAGLSAGQVYAAVGAGPAIQGPDADTGALRELSFDESGMAVLQAALKAASRLGHKQAGTGHLLLGVLEAGGPAAEALAGLGLTPGTAERLLAEVAKTQAPGQGG
jgi:Clp amino terminal domain, pathogenicity island component